EYLAAHASQPTGLARGNLRLDTFGETSRSIVGAFRGANVLPFERELIQKAEELVLDRLILCRAISIKLGKQAVRLKEPAAPPQHDLRIRDAVIVFLYSQRA